METTLCTVKFSEDRVQFLIDVPQNGSDSTEIFFADPLPKSPLSTSNLVKYTPK